VIFLYSVVIYKKYNKDFMKKIVMKPGCTSCGACEFNAPDVFEVTDISRVKDGVDVEEKKEQIERAIQGCPFGVIAWYDDEKS